MKLCPFLEERSVHYIIRTFSTAQVASWVIVTGQATPIMLLCLPLLLRRRRSVVFLDLPTPSSIWCGFPYSLWPSLVIHLLESGMAITHKLVLDYCVHRYFHNTYNNITDFFITDLVFEIPADLRQYNIYIVFKRFLFILFSSQNFAATDSNAFINNFVYGEFLFL